MEIELHAFSTVHLVDQPKFHPYFPYTLRLVCAHLHNSPPSIGMPS